MKRTALFSGVIMLLTACVAEAVSPVNASRLNGVAIRGYDPVAYFTEQKPVEGNPELSLDWNGAIWRFVSAENRDRFVAEPTKYAPQFGGYCAWAVAHGYVYDADPEVWRISEGKLYLNFDQEVQAKWSQDIPGWVAHAEENWPKLLAEK